MKKKSVLSLLLALLLLFSAIPAAAQNFQTVAGVAVLMEASTGQFLYLKNADEQRPPASLTKIMTLLLTFEALERDEIQWDQTTVVSERAWQKEGSTMYLQVDTEVSVEELIKGISIVSANDGCVAMAELLSGSEEAFVQRMNQRAQELGMINTQFQNSNGLPATNHYMSARDVAILARELIVKHPRILEFEAQREFTYGGIKQQNRNPLLGRFAGADGLKTGWTPESGYSLAGTALQNGIRLISVTLNTKDNQERLLASQELLNYGFKNFTLTQVVAKDETVGEIPVTDGKQQTVALTVAEDVSILIPNGREDDLELVVTEEKSLTAPIEQGTEAATLLIQLEGEN
ncbi:MAG: D-alanyl-D-alanine carboxypeptidase, partial [Firmicutes bacterium]|nr:D-alanyl-D-alanine carboxypeptidase [Bacillota bacterium]